MDKQRIFIAIVPELNVVESLSDRIEVLSKRSWGKNVKWVKKKNLHITIKFLGEMEKNNLEELIGTIKRSLINTEKFKIDVNDLIFFPNRIKPRVIGVGVKSKKLLKIVNKIENELAKKGFPREKRKFKGHITLGRFKRKSYPKKIDERYSSKLSFYVNEIVINQSDLLPEGPIYNVLKRFKLK